MKYFASLVMLSVLFVSAANAELMAIWDFGSDAASYTEDAAFENVVGSPSLIVSGGDKDDNGKDGTDFTDAAGVFHAEGQAAAWNDVRVSGLDAFWIMTINTTNFKNLNMRWDYKSWEAQSLDFAYSIDNGKSWDDIANNFVINNDEGWYSLSFDLRGTTDVENRNSVIFRVDDLEENGNDKFAFDNIQLTGTRIPEPCSIGLLGLGLLAVRRKRRS